MALQMESCCMKEVYASVNGSEKLLNELREALEDWLKLQPHLPQDVPKERLEHFIIATKMSLEQAKRKLDMYYSMRPFAPELCANRDPRACSLTYLHSITEIVYLPKLTPEKYSVCIMRLRGHDCSKLNGYDPFKYAGMIEELLIMMTHNLGGVYVFDLAIISPYLLTKVTPTLIKKCEVALTEGHAKRIKGIHFINATPLAESVISLAKKIVKPKIRSRVHTHVKGSYESFYQHIPKSILPKDYGGDELSMTQLAEMWRQKVDDHRDWFLEEDKIVVNERLRPGSSFNIDSVFGFSGSFRKLEVD